VENFIKFVPGTPFQGTLPGELVKKLGSPAPEVGMAALSFFARSSNSQLCCCSLCCWGLDGEQRALERE